MTKLAFNPAPELKTALVQQTASLLEGIGEISGRMGAEAYLVGGLVRDMFLGVDNVDLDIAIVGDGLAVARRLARTLKARILAHERFLTATLVVPDKIRIDIATARSERYERPGALPCVAPASIEEDLFRRDITINAMAASLAPGHFGAIRDPYGGAKDLRAGLVRILHPASLRDDPTRILRIIRFAARFGFELEEGTRRCLNEALSERVLGAISSDRLRAEIFLSLNEPDPGAVFQLMKEKEVMAQALPGIVFDEEVASSMIRGQRIMALVAREPGWEPEWVGLMLLLGKSSRAAVQKALTGLNLGGRAERVLGQAWHLSSLERKTGGLRKQSELHAELQRAPLELQLALLASAADGAHRRRLLHYITQGRALRPELTGEDLKAMGFPPGPPMRKILSALMAAKLDGRLRDRKAEERFVSRSFRARGRGECRPGARACPRRTINARR